MGKNQSASNLTNIIKQDANGGISFMSGSTMLMALSNTGQMSGSAPAMSAVTASYADNFTVKGTLTAQTLVVQTITSSVDFVTGSTRFGSLSSNTHVFTGSVSVSGSISGTSATFSGALTTGGVSINNGTQFRVYNVGNGDYGNLTFATATGFTFDKGATFSNAVTSGGTIFANYGGGQIKISGGSVTSGIFQGTATPNLFIGDWDTATKGISLNISTGAATFSNSVTAASLSTPGNLNYTSGDGVDWYINPPSNGPTIRLKYHGGSTNRSGGLGWVNNSGGRTEALTWADNSVSFGGVVTKPYQPAFRAYYSVNGIWTLGNEAVFVFDSTEYNIGSCYNTSNGRFTAPVAGVYQFNFYTIVSGNYSNAAIAFRKNGNALTSGYNVHFSPYYTSTSWSNVVYTTSLYLNANDYVSMFNTGGSTQYHGDDWSSFSGYLVG